MTLFCCPIHCSNNHGLDRCNAICGKYNVKPSTKPGSSPPTMDSTPTPLPIAPSPSPSTNTPPTHSQSPYHPQGSPPHPPGHPSTPQPLTLAGQADLLYSSTIPPPTTPIDISSSFPPTNPVDISSTSPPLPSSSEALPLSDTPSDNEFTFHWSPSFGCHATLPTYHPNVSPVQFLPPVHLSFPFSNIVS